ASGDPEAAEGRARDALKLAEDVGLAGLEWRAHAMLATACAAGGKTGAAARHARRALAIVKDVWFELRGAQRETFLAHPEVKALEEVARRLVTAGGGDVPAEEEKATSTSTSTSTSTKDGLTDAATHAFFCTRLDEE